MNVYSLFPFLAFLSNLFLGLYLLLINRHEKRNLLFFGVCVFLSLWSLSHYMMFTVSFAEEALFWDRLSTVASSFQGVFLLHFVLVFTRSRFEKSFFLLAFLYGSAAIFSFLDFFTSFFTASIVEQYWGFSTISGPWYVVLALYTMVIALCSFFISFQSFLKSKKGFIKSQTGLLAFAISIPLVGGIITQVIAPIFGIVMLPLTSSLTAVMALIIGVSISRFKMFKSTLFSIRKKLLVGFFVISLLSAVLGHTAISSSNDALFEVIGRSSVTLADETIDKIDRVIDNQLTHWSFVAHSCLLLSKSLSASNEEFDDVENVSALIDERETMWIASDDTSSELVSSTLNNNLSVLFLSYADFYNQNASENLVDLIYATNKYGVIVSQTSKASDYDQSDESWFVKTVENGSHVSDVRVDESTGEDNTVAICIRVDDDSGQMLGVLKVIFNVEPLFYILSDLIEDQDHSMSFSLLTGKGNIIYSTHEYVFYDAFSQELFSKFDKDTSSRFFLSENSSGLNCGEVLVGYAFSSGHGLFDGVGWILVYEQSSIAVFNPISDLLLMILVLTVLIVLCSLVFGFWFSNSFSRPILKLNDAALKMSEGNLDANIDVVTHDEIGQLADAFEKMRKNLKQSYDTLELQVEQRTTDLKSKVEELEKFKKVTVNRELRMVELKQKLSELEQKAAGSDKTNEM